MDTLREFLQYGGAGFVLAALLAPLIISILYNGGFVVRHVLMRTKVNEEFVKLQKHKSGTPTMGGLIVVLPFLLLALILLPDTPLRNVFAAGFTLFAIYGFLDEVIVKLNIQNKQFREFQETFLWRMGKLAVLIGVGVVVALLMGRMLGIDSVELLPGFSIPFTGLFSLLWGFLIVAGTYGAEITDGLDGLVTGLFLTGYGAYGVICLIEGRMEVLPMIAVLMGTLLVYLYFNITPARVFMGGVGAVPLGFGLVFLALLTNTLLPFVVITIVFWVELFSSFSQILSIRFLHRKLFRIAPIHHHFESLGWSEPKIVMRFWLVGWVMAAVGLWLFAVIR